MSALAGLRVIDAATLFAGPTAATMLADFGAEVIKIEHPTKGDPVRGHGYSKDGQSLWWANIGRNKSTLALNLGNPEGAEVFLDLVAHCDVLIENFRPGTLERWGIGPSELHQRNRQLIIARVTGFGQFGPYAHRAGFGTLAESMSGFATMTGEPDRPPTLPPFALADGVSALAITQAIMFALFSQKNPASEGFGKGQVIDLAIIEPILAILGPHATVYDQLGVIPTRTGNRSVNNSPRNTYLTRDKKWLAVSTSAQSIAERVMRLVGHPEVIDHSWFSEGSTRAQHAEILDRYVGDWISQRDASDVVREFEKAEAAVAPIYNIADIMDDPQFQALETIIEVNDLTLGPIKMQNVLFRMDQTPGAVHWTGRAIGADSKKILKELLGMSDERVDSLIASQVIGVSEL